MVELVKLNRWSPPNTSCLSPDMILCKSHGGANRQYSHWSKCVRLKGSRYQHFPWQRWQLCHLLKIQMLISLHRPQVLFAHVLAAPTTAAPGASLWNGSFYKTDKAHRSHHDHARHVLCWQFKLLCQNFCGALQTGRGDYYGIQDCCRSTNCVGDARPWSRRLSPSQKEDYQHLVLPKRTSKAGPQQVRVNSGGLPAYASMGGKYGNAAPMFVTPATPPSKVCFRLQNKFSTAVRSIISTIVWY